MTLAIAQQFCTFFIDKQFFAVPVQQVQEVIRYQEMTRVPLVPPVIRGLINLRGQIVVALICGEGSAIPTGQTTRNP